MSRITSLRRRPRQNRHEIGPVDILVNNAGITATPCSTNDAGAVHEVINTNLNSLFNMSVVIRGLRERGFGRISTFLD